MKKLIFGLLAVVLLTSCHKDKFNMNRLKETSYSPSIAAPIINSDLDVYDIMAHTDSSDVVVIDQNTGQVALVYDGKLLSFKGEDFVNLPGQTENIIVSPTGYPYSGSVEYQIDPGNSQNQIDSVRLKNGSISLQVNGTVNSGDLSITIPGLKKNGFEFSKTINISSGSGSGTYSLNGYTWDLTAAPSYSYNGVEVEFAMNNGSNGGTMNIDAGLSNMEYRSIFGDFGSQQIPFTQDSILLRVFKNSAPGIFQLVDSKLELDIQNSFGLPLNIHIDTLRAINFQTGNADPIGHDQDSFLINAPELVDFGDSAHTFYAFDSANSEIHSVVNSTPKWIHHSVHGETNPPSTSQYNFITDESRISIHSKLKMPLTGYAHGWSLVDTVEFKMAEERLDNVEKVLIRTIIDNGFPFNVDVQLYMTDEDTNIVDSVYHQGTEQIVSGNVDNQGKVTSSTKKVTDVEIDDNRKDELLETRHLIIKANARTQNALSGQDVSIYDTYLMNVKLGLKVDGTFSLAGGGN